MPRALLALLLCLFAASAAANPVAASNDDACPAPKQTKAVVPVGSPGDPESESPHSSTATTTHVPIRIGTPRAVAPRWHSLLPGMFR